MKKLIFEEEGFTISEVREDSINSYEKAEPYLREVIGDDMDKQEVLIVMALNNKSKIIFTKMIHKGTVNSSMVHPREVFSDAIRERASGIIMCHNHPSGGVPYPSDADNAITKKIKECGELLGVSLLDHIILTNCGAYSYSDMDKL